MWFRKRSSYDLHKMPQFGNSYTIDRKRDFPNNSPSFKKATIKTVFDFAYDMTFGAKGEHRHYRSGGSKVRKNGEIFANTFQGKLAECAVCNALYTLDDSIIPDFSITGLGSWDTVDLNVGKKKIAIKSTKSFGNLLLLEKSDWASNGTYIPNNINYDYFVLVRINPFCEELLARNRILYCDTIDKQNLFEIIDSESWRYENSGFVSLKQVVFAINNGFVIHKGDLLNNKIEMDADNYYIQLGDMGTINELYAELQK